MKIMELVFGLASGGAERMVVDLCNRFSADGHDVILEVVEDLKKNDNSFYVPDVNKNVQVESVGAKNGYSWKAIWGTFLAIHRHKPDVVHLHAGAMILLLPVLFCKKVRYVHTIHSLAHRYAPSAIKKAISQYLYRGSKIQPVTISKTCHQSYLDFYGLTNDVCITNGREALTTTPAFASVKQEISLLKKSEDTPVFIHVARHHPVKNHERLFGTFEILQREGVDFTLIVLGDRYEAYEPKYKTNPQIHLLGPKSNIGDYMACADYFTLTSDQEGLPLTLLEAMSMGVIPVCTPAGGIADVIIDGKNGYMPERVDDELYYQSVKRALAGREKLNRQAIIKEYEDNYSMKVCADKYMEVYKKHNL